MSSQKQERVDEARLQTITRGPLPGSRKAYVAGTRHPDVRVPMREISQTPTREGHGEGARLVPNPPVTVYDTSGPYTDPDAVIDVRRGLPPLRAEWIRSRDDVEELSGVSSLYGQNRLEDRGLDALRFHTHRKPLRAKPGRTVTQMHYARKGIVTPEMEYVAIREQQRAAAIYRKQHPGRAFGAKIPETYHARVRPRRDRAGPRDFAGEREPPGDRADDHRSQFPGEDQREHRQQRHQLVDRGRSRKDGLVDPLGRGHRDGSLDGPEHPRDAGMDPPQCRPCRSAPCPFTRRSRRSAEKPRSCSWEIYRDTLIEQAEQGVDYFTIHAGVLLATCRSRRTA